ncbi:CWF19-like 2, cell cycle control, isoform CRA_b [Neoconidiobolus thromboides FSU 785]|nr:CWF19-like 2, cell cycle control, isoform CRA_b [Neoconidiobolus thromboides FSU 785]
MKSLMRMFATLEKGVIFMETVMNLNHFKHTVIECIPLPWDLSQDATAYFKEGLIDIADEWSQHKKIINTKERTFRKSMTSNLPYFHVWFHPDGGLGHIIEESEKFKSYFGKEIIAGMLDLDISLWRKPKYQDSNENKSRVDKFNKKFPWENYDWTKLLD